MGAHMLCLAFDRIILQAPAISQANSLWFDSIS